MAPLHALVSRFNVSSIMCLLCPAITVLGHAKNSASTVHCWLVGPVQKASATGIARRSKWKSFDLHTVN